MDRRVADPENPMADKNILELTADIVAAYAANNHLPQDELPDLIGAVHASLTRMSSGGELTLT